MTKADIINEIFYRTGLPKKDIALVVNAVFEVMREALEDEKRIEIRGFGVFSIKVRKPKVGRNPKTGQVVHIPERKVVHFKPSKLLKEALENKGVR